MSAAHSRGVDWLAVAESGGAADSLQRVRAVVGPSICCRVSRM